MVGLCCQIRTGVLFLGFLLGFMEVTLWVMFYTWRVEFRKSVGYTAGTVEFDLIIVTVMVGIDLVVNVMMISGANKDYSGRRKDLRRWGFMVPWIIAYGVNILVLFATSIVLFYSLSGGYKALGLVPLTLGCALLMGHFAVLFFLMEQRSDFLSGACNNIVSEASSPS